MALPLALTPLAWTAFRIGAVAAVAIVAARKGTQPKDPRHEAVLDDLPTGVAARPHRAEAERAVHGEGRFRRVIGLGGGPRFEVEAAGIGRLRVRRVA